MFNFFKKEKRGQGMNAVVPSDKGIAYACIQRNAGQPPTLSSLHFSELDNKAETTSALKQLVKDFQLENKEITTSLLIADSNLVMLEKPEVADEELRQAVRWKIKDSLPYNINNAIVDVFEIPGQRERGRTPLVYVTAAEKEFLKQKIKTFEEHDLEISSIDIAELVMRNIAALLPEDQQGVALLKLEPDQGLITLTQDSSLYLARNIDVGYVLLGANTNSPMLGSNTTTSILGETPAEGDDSLAFEQEMSPDQQRSLDAIVLEVQRSLDYYESHFAKPAINSLVIAPLPYEVPGLIKYLAGALGLQVRMLDLNAVLDMPQPVSEEQQAKGFFAIGAALREPVLPAQLKQQKKGQAA